MRARLLLITGTLVLFVFILGTLYFRGYLLLNNPPKDAYPIRGVDVSHHQGEIDWEGLISEERLSFAFIKASEGETLRDPDRL